MTDSLKDRSESELQRIIDDANRALRDKQEGRKKEVIAEIRRLAGSAGLSVEINEGNVKSAVVASGRRGGKVAPKYRNPDNQEQTWTGRGMRPVWLRDLIAGGRSLEEFEIK